MPYYIKKKKKEPLFADKLPKAKVSKKVDLVAKLDKVFSLYIRLRDTMPTGCFKCISCGQIKPYEQADCGHYFSRRHMATRFDEYNCNAECRSCNRFSADHLHGYRGNLIRKIGQRNFDLLEFRSKQFKKFTDFELQERIKYYTNQVSMLKIQKNMAVK